MLAGNHHSPPLGDPAHSLEGDEKFATDFAASCRILSVSGPNLAQGPWCRDQGQLNHPQVVTMSGFDPYYFSILVFRVGRGQEGRGVDEDPG